MYNSLKYNIIQKLNKIHWNTTAMARTGLKYVAKNLEKKNWKAICLGKIKELFVIYL